jgi:hypothetical protein
MLLLELLRAILSRSCSLFAICDPFLEDFLAVQFSFGEFQQFTCITTVLKPGVTPTFSSSFCSFAFQGFRAFGGLATHTTGREYREHQHSWNQIRPDSRSLSQSSEQAEWALSAGRRTNNLNRQQDDGAACAESFALPCHPATRNDVPDSV